MAADDGKSETASTTTPYQMMGGEAVIRRVVDRFYDLMDADPSAHELRAMHAQDLAPMRERLFEFLSGWLGGPPLYFQRPDQKCIVSAHRPFAIGEAVRDQWMACMRQALVDCDVPVEVRTLIDAPLLRMAEAFRNR